MADGQTAMNTSGQEAMNSSGQILMLQNDIGCAEVWAEIGCDVSCLTLRITFANAAPVDVSLRATTWDLVWVDTTGDPVYGFLSDALDTGSCTWVWPDGTGEEGVGDWDLMWFFWDGTNTRWKVTVSRGTAGVSTLNATYTVATAGSLECPTLDVDAGWTLTCVG